MKNSLFALTFCAMLLINGCGGAGEPMHRLIKKQLDFAETQYLKIDSELPADQALRSWDTVTNSLVTSGPGWWCSGFYPGSLWLLYGHSGNEALKDIAVRRTELLRGQQYNTGTHDLGFILYNSFGKGLEYMDSSGYREVLLNGAKSLICRYDPKIGMIKSWNHKVWEYPVIIDNMMNLEYLFWATRETGDSTYYRIAVTHARNTISNHFRDDFSSWHVVNFDTLTGELTERMTYQGTSDSSAWARGQAWGLYGFTMMFRETGDSIYLEQARRIAYFVLGHPNMPPDLIPYWDYNAPGIPDEPRDVSSAAIMASALAELATYVPQQEFGPFILASIRMIRSLSSPPYINNTGGYGHFILLHSVGAKPINSEVDVPLTYADYYYIEALLRLEKIIEGKFNRKQ